MGTESHLARGGAPSPCILYRELVELNATSALPQSPCHFLWDPGQLATSKDVTKESQAGSTAKTP